MAERPIPIRPEPRPMRLGPASTAVLVLDLSTRCDDPAAQCAKLLDGVGAFLDRGRAAGVPTIFTVSYAAKGTAEGDVASALKRRPTETVLYPDGFDKFTGGELQGLLAPRGTQHLVITGSATNFAVLYTATGAARNHHYHVVVPLDGVNAANSYEHEYSLHQLSVLPRVAPLIEFSTLSMIEFG